MPKTKHSPVKLLSDLGIDVMNLSSQEDYKSALIEGLAKLQYTGDTGSERFKILQNEVRRVKKEQEKAKDPTYTTKEERPPIVKKTKITGADIKRTGAIGSAQKVAADTTGASDIVPFKKPSTDVAKSEDVTPDKEEMMNPLQKLNNSVKSIVETLKQSNKDDIKARKDARKAAEKKKRKGAESKLEKLAGPLNAAGDKILAPIKSIWSKILGFIQTIFFGHIALKLWDWFANPKNAEKVASIFRFIKDWWPVLVAGIMAIVGPGVTFALGLIALLTWGIPKIIDAVKWVGSLFGIGVQKEVDNITKSSDKTAADLEKNVEGDLQNDTKGILKEGPNTEKEPQQVTKVKEEAQDSKDKVEKMQDLPTMNQFNEGGVVPGSGTKDTVPAMLTPGEFVMNRDAVQKYGVEHLEGMNAAAGGTNLPMVGLPGLGGGGGGTNSLTEQAKVKTFGSALGDFFSGDDGRSRRKTDHDKWMEMAGGGLVQHFSGGGLVPQGYDKSPNDVKKEEGKSKSAIGQVANVGKRLSKWLLPLRALPFVGKKLASSGKELVAGVQELIAGQHESIHQTGSSAAQIAKSPPKETPIKPPSRPTTKVAYDQAMQNQQRTNASESPGQDLPSFSSTSMRSISKIKTLGISV